VKHLKLVFVLITLVIGHRVISSVSGFHRRLKAASWVHFLPSISSVGYMKISACLLLHSAFQNILKREELLLIIGTIG
jgi:hypothetical protein